MKPFKPKTNLVNEEEELISAPIKPYSKQELQQLYEVSYKSFSKWLKPLSKQLGKRHGRFYNLSQVQTMFSNFGVPLVRR